MGKNRIFNVPWCSIFTPMKPITGVIFLAVSTASLMAQGQSVIGPETFQRTPNSGNAYFAELPQARPVPPTSQDEWLISESRYTRQTIPSQNFSMETAAGGMDMSAYGPVTISLDTVESVVSSSPLGHHSGVAGHVLLVPVLMANQQVSPYQATLKVSVQRDNFTRQINQITTAADGNFFLFLPPGTYIITPILPQVGLNFATGLSNVPVTVTVHPRQTTSVEIDVFDSGGNLGL